jgi:tRNA/rRNA methyltransferase
MPRLNQLFNRAQLTVEEIHILRGIAKMMARADTPNTALPSGLAGDQ